MKFWYQNKVINKRDDATWNSEQRLHRLFQEKRGIGEWFDLTEDDVTYIKSIESE